MQPLLTIIVPAYNAERFLPLCLESIRAQTKPTRLLIANDGSTDQTGSIAETTAKREPFVQVLHLPHAGLIATRKAAIAAIQTPYFAFVDADDAIDPTFVEQMMEGAIQHRADMVFCPHTCIYDGVAHHVEHGGADERYVQAEFPIRKCPHLLMGIPTYYWGKIFRTEYVRPRIVFPPEDSIPVEDIPVTVPLFIEMPRILKVSTPLYRYNIVPDSMCRISRQELNRLVSMRTLEGRLEDIGALPKFLPQLQAINRCYLFDQLEKMRYYSDPSHQHRVVKEYFRHLGRKTLRGWKPHPFHPTFYRVYWHWRISRKLLKFN